jgi:hypothetical protein
MFVPWYLKISKPHLKYHYRSLNFAVFFELYVQMIMATFCRNNSSYPFSLQLNFNLNTLTTVSLDHFRNLHDLSSLLCFIIVTWFSLNNCFNNPAWPTFCFISVVLSLILVFLNWRLYLEVLFLCLKCIRSYFSNFSCTAILTVTADSLSPRLISSSISVKNHQSTKNSNTQPIS